MLLVVDVEVEVDDVLTLDVEELDVDDKSVAGYEGI